MVCKGKQVIGKGRAGVRKKSRGTGKDSVDNGDGISTQDEVARYKLRWSLKVMAITTEPGHLEELAGWKEGKLT